ncbi:glycosyltransferase family 2 protein [Streptococcus suis]|nr:glycosyltransferase family 2 protein [Streptococcus suis]
MRKVMPSVSVIVIGYNTEQFIEECLKSIMNQTFPDIEIICVDDGSTDNTLSLMQQMASIDSRIVVVHQENSGPFAARNKGMELAKGKYIVFVDSDDWIDVELISDTFTIAEKYQLDMVFYDYVKEHIHENSIELNPLLLPENQMIFKEDIQRIVYPKCMQNSSFSSPCNKMIRREFLISHHHIQQTSLRYGEDLLFLLELYHQLEKTYYIPHSYYHYRIHSSESLSQRHTENAFFIVHKKLYEAREPYAQVWGVMSELYANTVYLGLAELFFDVKRKPNFLTLNKYFKDPVFVKSIKMVEDTDLLKISKSSKVVLFKKIVKLLLKCWNLNMIASNS